MWRNILSSVLMCFTNRSLVAVFFHVCGGGGICFFEPGVFTGRRLGCVTEVTGLGWVKVPGCGCICVWCSWTGEKVNQDSGSKTRSLCFPSRCLLTDSGGGRRALELQAWVQLTCPLTGTCPGAEGGAWPRPGASAKGAAGPEPEPGPGAWFVPGQGWEPCGARAWGGRGPGGSIGTQRSQEGSKWNLGKEARKGQRNKWKEVNKGDKSQFKATRRRWKHLTDSFWD